MPLLRIHANPVQSIYHPTNTRNNRRDICPRFYRWDRINRQSPIRCGRLNALLTWAYQYGIPQTAYLALVRILRAPAEPLHMVKHPLISEAAVQQRTQLLAAKSEGILWRNNVGVAVDPAGRPVRYGLANISKQMNTNVKSSDLIGITPVVVTSLMVGSTVGVFTSIECKHMGWNWGEDTERETAQLKYHHIVTSMGGIAGFVSDPEQFTRLIK